MNMNIGLGLPNVNPMGVNLGNDGLGQRDGGGGVRMLNYKQALMRGATLALLKERLTPNEEGKYLEAEVMAIADEVAVGAQRRKEEKKRKSEEAMNVRRSHFKKHIAATCRLDSKANIMAFFENMENGMHDGIREMLMGDYWTSERVFPHTSMRESRRCLDLWFRAKKLLEEPSVTAQLQALNHPSSYWQIALYNIMNNQENVKLVTSPQHGSDALTLNEAVNIMLTASLAFTHIQAGREADFKMYGLFVPHKKSFKLALADLRLEVALWKTFTLCSVDLMPVDLDLPESIALKIREAYNCRFPDRHYVPEVILLKLLCAGLPPKEALNSTHLLVSMVQWKAASGNQSQLCPPIRACNLSCFEMPWRVASPAASAREGKSPYPCPEAITTALTAWRRTLFFIYGTARVENFLTSNRLDLAGMPLIRSTFIPKTEWAARLFQMLVDGAPQKLALLEAPKPEGLSEEDIVLEYLVAPAIYIRILHLEQYIFMTFFTEGRHSTPLPILHVIKRLRAVAAVAKFLANDEGQAAHLKELISRVDYAQAQRDATLKLATTWERESMLLAAGQESEEDEWIQDIAHVMTIRMRQMEKRIFGQSFVIGGGVYDDDKVSFGLSVWKKLAQLMSSSVSVGSLAKYGVMPSDIEKTEAEKPLLLLMLSGIPLDKTADLIPPIICLQRMGLTENVLGNFLDMDKSDDDSSLSAANLQTRLERFGMAAEYQHRERRNFIQGMKDRGLYGVLSATPRAINIALYRYILNGKEPSVSDFLYWQVLFRKITSDTDRTSFLVQEYLTASSGVVASTATV